MNQIDVISNAVSLMGKGVVTTLANPTPIVSAAIQAYNTIFQEDMETNNWRFSCKIVRLFNESSNNTISGFSGVNNTLTLTNSVTDGTVYQATFTTNNTLPTTNPQIVPGTTYFVFTINNAIRIFSNAFDAQNNVNFFTIANAGVGNNIVNVAPVGGYWLYSYILPDDYLKPVHQWPQNWEYEIYNNSQLYSNYNDNSNVATPNPLYLEYQSMPDITTCPNYYALYLIYRIAAYLSLSTAQNVQYAQHLEQMADIQRSKAQATDCQNRPQSFLQNSPALSQRFVSTYASG